ncbi:MAG: pantoate--beta-alanine ligase [Planctomycetota bacterium]
MILVRRIQELKKIIKRVKQRNRTVGLVPTMGALHEGHLSLIRTARRETDFVVASIFVNPLQFGPQEDYKKYPRRLKKDLILAESAGANLVFAPTARELYSSNLKINLDIPSLSNRLCGLKRPGHFQGVLTVVNKLFNLVEPDIAYFGQKDYQQARLIKTMAGLLNMNLKIKISPIIRAPDGLALSSRNQYLSSSQRQNAVCLYRALSHARNLIKNGEKYSSEIIKKIRFMINSAKGTRIDYIAITNPLTLTEITKINRRPVLVALAVYVGRTRLIDNILI